MRTLTTVAALALLAACASAPPPPAGERKVPNAVAGLLPLGDGVYAWVSSPWSFSTTSYAIEGSDGLVLVDTQFLPKETIAFVDDVEKFTGKRAVAAVVLHANPDKFNGTKVLQDRGVRVVTSAQVKQLIPAVHEKRVKAFAERYAPDYPTELPNPDVFGEVQYELDAAGTRVTLVPAGPGCSAAHVILKWKDHVFAGDLLANGSHAWLEIGETAEWLKRLDEIDAMTPARVYPGRGLPAGPELVARQRAYLNDVILAVKAQNPAGEPDDAALERARKQIVERHPDLRFAVFLNIGLPAEWRRQAAAAQ